MEFKLKKKEVLLTTVSLSLTMIFVAFIFGSIKFYYIGLILFLCILTYRTLKYKSDVYRIKQEVLYLNDSSLIIPINEINEITVKMIEVKH